MAALLPPLEEISQQHPEPVIQELASDLRATIATHGAYRSESVPRAASQHRPAQTTGHCSNTHPAKISSSKPHSNPTSNTNHKDSTSASLSHTPPMSHPKHATDPVEVPKVLSHSAKPKSGNAFRQTAEGVSDGSVPSSKVFSECLLEACDPDVPTRAVALRSLTRLCRDGGKEALDNKDKLLTVSLWYIHIHTFTKLKPVFYYFRNIQYIRYI